MEIKITVLRRYVIAILLISLDAGQFLHGRSRGDNSDMDVQKDVQKNIIDTGASSTFRKELERARKEAVKYPGTQERGLGLSDMRY